MIIAVAVLISAAMAVAWWVQRRTRNASWVDAIWSLTSGAGGALYAALAIAEGAPAWRAGLIGALCLAWGGRLGIYIAARAAKGHEDPRYTALRDRWGAAYEPRMFAFLQLQALIAWLLALSVRAAARNPVHHLRALDIAGLVVLAIAVLGESLADHQLHRFRADPRQRRPHLRHRAVGLVAPPQLFLRMARLDRLPALRLGCHRRLSRRLDRARRPDHDVLAAGLCQRRRPGRGGDGKIPRQRLPGLSRPCQPLLPLAAQKT